VSTPPQASPPAILETKNLENFYERRGMNTKLVIEELNGLLEEELAAIVRYLHHSFLVFGPARIPIVEHFRKRAKDAASHAVLIGEKITALGGHPTVKISEVLEPGKQTVEDMLREDLEAEKGIINHYNAVLPLVTENVAIHFLLCRIMEEEQLHIEELEKLIRKE
jgi:bacterioferritin